jgi:type IV pilus assembly protein PilX
MKHRLPFRSASRQRGVVLLFSLVALVVLLIAAVALMRSFNTSLFMSGNIAFKRDLQNQGERAMDQVLADFRAGGLLDNDAARSGDLQSRNYSAVALPANAQGIPADLVLGDSAFAAKWTFPDIEPAGQAVKVRYVIDRMSAATGSCKTLGPGVCVLAGNTVPAGGSASNLQNATRSSGSPAAAASGVGKGVSTGTVVYRLTARVSGPRDTQAFFQSTFSAP